MCGPNPLSPALPSAPVVAEAAVLSLRVLHSLMTASDPLSSFSKCFCFRKISCPQRLIAHFCIHPLLANSTEKCLDFCLYIYKAVLYSGFKSCPYPLGGCCCLSFSVILMAWHGCLSSEETVSVWSSRICSQMGFRQYGDQVLFPSLTEDDFNTEDASIVSETD